MKKIIALFALAILGCLACNREYELKRGDSFSVSDGTHITYWCNTGNSLETAVDSLQRMYNRTHPNLYIKQERLLIVDFPYDSRTFWKLSFSESTDPVIESDVVDSRGNLYFHFGVSRNKD